MGTPAAVTVSLMLMIDRNIQTYTNMCHIKHCTEREGAPCTKYFGVTPRPCRERSGRVLDLRPKDRGFEPHRHHCVVSLSKNINPSLVLVQPRKTRPFILKDC